jgi:hypothetical protein
MKKTKKSFRTALDWKGYSGTGVCTYIIYTTFVLLLPHTAYKYKKNSYENFQKNFQHFFYLFFHYSGGAWFESRSKNHHE